ncbi:MAG: BatD family protein [Bacteroidales bacterium]|nr:BatD family protein [Bacteroidales bacterium]
MKKIFFIIGFLAAFVGQAAAQSLTVEAPNLVAVGEQFNVSFVYDGNASVSDFQWDGGADFQVVWGPQQGSSTSISIVNGKTTKTVRRSYTYVLQVTAPGVFILPSANLNAKGKVLMSPERRIEVVGAARSQQPSSASPQAGAPSGNGNTSSSAQVEAGNDIILKMVLDKRTVTLGEPIRATLKLYQRVNITGFDDVKLPSFNNFWSQDVTPPGDINFVRENYKGAIYNAAIIKDYVIIPQKSGQLVIEPAELVCLVYQRISHNTGSIFDGFFDDYTTLRKRVNTEPVTVTVRDLPRPAPAGFCGGVGKFEISARVSRDSLKTHEAASLFVTVKGKGNLSLLEAPKVQFPPDFELYDVKINDKIDKNSGGISGSRTYEFPFIPRSWGDFSIKPIEYAWYDSSAKGYVTAATPEIPLVVLRGEENATSNDPQIIIAGTHKKGVKDLGSDIRFIHTENKGLHADDPFLLGSKAFYILLVFILGGCAVVLTLGLIRRRRSADVVGSRKRKATRMARKRLKQAKALLDKGIVSAFYEELHKALVGFACDKLNMPTARFTKDNLQQELTARKVSAEDAQAFIDLLDACEMARYSPTDGQDAMRRHFEQAEQLISNLDSRMTDKKTLLPLIAFLLLLTGAPAARAATDYVDSLWTKATADYSAGQYDAAAQDYASIAALGLQSADLQYNWGNACYKQKDYGRAILHYEKALKLDPSMDDARYNLEMAQSFTVDDIEQVPELIFVTFFRKMRNGLSANVWTWIFLLLLAVGLAFAVLFFLQEDTGARRRDFFCALAALLIAALCFSFAARQKADYTAQDSAVIVRSVVEVRSSPTDEGASSLFILHEGTKVRLLDSVGNWKNIELSDGRQGWMKASDLEII